jgi:hypothetical protein
MDITGLAAHTVESRTHARFQRGLDDRLGRLLGDKYREYARGYVFCGASDRQYRATEATTHGIHVAIDWVV